LLAVMGMSLPALPNELLERVVKHLDALSALLLSCVSRRLECDVLRLWAQHQASAPPPPDHLAGIFTRSADAALARSALHTPSPCFIHSSLIPFPLPLRHAAAALDIARLIVVLSPPQQCAPEPVPGKAPTPAKISALQTAVLCRSSRAVSALIGEYSISPRLRLDLDAQRLPNAHLGKYTVPAISGKRARPGGVYKTKVITVRTISNPDAVVSLVDASVLFLSRTCVNTRSLLELAVLTHDAASCELLCARPGIEAPLYALSELIDPALSLCGASAARLGAEASVNNVADASETTPEDFDCMVSQYKSKEGWKSRGKHRQKDGKNGTKMIDDYTDKDTKSRAERSANEGDRKVVDEIEHSPVILSFCEDLDACRYASTLLRITLALSNNCRLQDEISINARHMAADYGDMGLVSLGYGTSGLPESMRAVIVKRQRWRLLYEAAKVSSAWDPAQTRVYVHSCSTSCPSTNVRAKRSWPATDCELVSLVFPYMERVRVRRLGVIKELSID
jgi:hypothetical protein